MSYLRLPPVPPDKIQEIHSWRDWFQFLNRMFGAGAVHTIQPNLIDFSNITTVTSNTQMTDQSYVYVATVTGKTVTLPKADVNMIGCVWEVNLSCLGTVTIVVTAGDSIMTPANATETTIVLSVRGSTLRIRCVSTSTWIIV